MSALATPEPVRLESDDLDNLCIQLREFKKLESDARDARIALEEQVTTLLGDKEEGTVSEKTEQFKVSITYGLTRKIDEKVWNEVKDSIEESLRSVIHYVEKPELDLKGLRWLKANRPDVFATVSQALTVSPRKPTVKVEVL